MALFWKHQKPKLIADVLAYKMGFVHNRSHSPLLFRLLLIAAFLPILPPTAHTAEDDIPVRLQGKWASAGDACGAGGEPIVISATSVVYPDGRFSDVYFAADSNAIRMRDKDSAAEYVVAGGQLVFHPEGSGKGSAFPMARCPEPLVGTERRCGWLAYLAPGDWWLVDRDKSWLLSKKVDDNPQTTAVMDRVPRFDAEQFVLTGEYYGYGCACLKVVADQNSGRITGIASSQRLPLAACEADKSLPAFGTW